MQFQSIDDNRPLRILIADDHEFTREGLLFSLGKRKSFQIVGTAKNGKEALQLAAEYKPHIVLMDIGMPVMDGIGATQAIKRDFPDTKVIILTSRQFKDEIYAAMSAGANAYCMKDISTEKLIQIVEFVFDGAIYIDPAIAKILIDILIASGSRNEQDANRTVNLTDRELEVLNLVALGKSNKEISNTLKISTNTVKLHLTKLTNKLAVDDRTQAAVKAIRLGLISTPNH